MAKNGADTRGGGAKAGKNTLCEECGETVENLLQHTIDNHPELAKQMLHNLQKKVTPPFAKELLKVSPSFMVVWKEPNGGLKEYTSDGWRIPYVALFDIGKILTKTNITNGFYVAGMLRSYVKSVLDPILKDGFLK